MMCLCVCDDGALLKLSTIDFGRTFLAITGPLCVFLRYMHNYVRAQLSHCWCSGANILIQTHVHVCVGKCV